ncbi:hypothetical protein D3C87_1036130 [compost metagenome]
MNSQPVNANAHGTCAKLKPSEVAPVNPNSFVNLILERIMTHPTVNDLESYFGPRWRYAIIGTEVEEVVLRAEEYGEL